MGSNLAVPIIVAVIGSGVLTTLVNWWFLRDKTEAETSAVLVDAAQELIAPLTEQLRQERTKVTGQGDRIRELEKQLRKVLRDVADLRDGVKRLSSQVESLGHTPVWGPEVDPG